MLFAILMSLWLILLLITTRIEGANKKKHEGNCDLCDKGEGGDSMKNLEIELYRYKELVFGRVLYMDERLRGKGILASVDNFTIKSRIVPQLGYGTLHVCGNERKGDVRVFFCGYETESEATEVCEKIAALVNIVNNSDKTKIENNIERIM